VSQDANDCGRRFERPLILSARSHDLEENGADDLDFDG
jgi:hypothetical protein